jgi:hypothetical protein
MAGRGNADNRALQDTPAKPGGLEDTATALIQNGCTAQLDLLIETVNVDEAAAPAA